jgi:hypothetical protein
MGYIEELDKIKENFKYDTYTLIEFEINSIYMEKVIKINKVFDKIENNHIRFNQILLGRKIKHDD